MSKHQPDTPIIHPSIIHPSFASKTMFFFQMYLYFFLATMTLVAAFQPNQIRNRKTSAIEHLNYLQSIRPILLSSSAAATVFVASSMPTPTHAYAFDNSNNLVISSIVTPQHYPTYDDMIASSSSMQLLSSSTIANPIGDLEDGSKTSSGASFGQWFFLLYVVVSLLAGGKEMLSRIQKQMDKDDS